MKKDALISIVAIVVIAGICFGLAAMRPPFEPTKSQPFTTAPVGKTVTGHVVMRINGEPITEDQFTAAFDALPDELRQQFATGPGKQAFAEQFVRMKILEQEAHRLGVDRDPKVEAQLAADRTNLLARAAADRLVANPTAQAVQSFYNQNPKRFETSDVSHILIAYRGSAAMPKDGSAPPTQVQAMNKALAIEQQLKSGANFATLAKQYSDDIESGMRGGHLGAIPHGALPPELDARVWQLKPGQISDPIPSKFGIHIFRVNARGPAPLGQVSTNISRHVKQQNTFDRIELLRKNTKVDFDPKFFPDAKNWPKQQG